MKKQVLTILLFGAAAFFRTNAQVIITRADFGVAGDKIYNAVDTTLDGTFSIGSAGASQAWNFNGKVSADVYDSIMFEDATGVPLAPTGSNLVMRSGTGGDQFFNVTNAHIKIVQDHPVEDTGSIMLTIAQFPMQFGKQFMDSVDFEKKGLASDFDIPIFDSAWIIAHVETSVNCDAWGVLTTPAGTFNALRTKTDVTNNVVVYGKGAATGNQWSEIFVQDQTTTEYGFMGQNSKMYLAQISVDKDGIPTSFIYKVNSVPTSIRNISADMIGLQVFPNPAQNNVTVTFDNASKGNVKAELVDITGKVMLKASGNGNELSFNVSELKNGIYFCRLTGVDFTTTKKITVSK